MTVWIVLKNGKVDEVFDDPYMAEAHCKNLKWSITRIVEKEVKRL
jgi:hypothetical protein